MGRTGDWLAHTVAGVTPDVVTLAKGLGGGIPIGACLADRPGCGAVRQGSARHHVWGNPVAAAAGLAVFGAIERDGLLDNARLVGELLSREIAHAHPAVTAVRGRGLLLAFDLSEPIAVQVSRAALSAGFIVNDVRPDAIRLAPPLILTPEQALEFTAALPAIIETALAAASSVAAGTGA